MFGSYRPYATLVCVAAACGPDAAPSPDVAVRVVDGVRFVEYGTRTEFTAPFVFSSQPLYAYGNGPEDYSFRRIWRGALLPDGSAAVIDALNAELILVAPDGTFQGVLAGRGDGPGELDRPIDVFSLGGDTILVDDQGHGRLTFFAAGAATSQIDTRPLLGRSARVLGRDAAGRLLLASSRYQTGFPEPWLQGHMILFDIEAGQIDTVAAYDWMPASPAEGPINPFGVGGMVVAVAQSFVQVRTDLPEVTWRNSDGTVHQVVRWRSPPVYPSEDDWRRFQSSMRDRLRVANPQIQSEDEFEGFMQRILADYELMADEPLPLFDGLFGDREGRVWLERFAAGSEVGIASGYSILASDGTWLGDVRTPVGVRLLDVSRNRALGVVTDDLGVESIMLYELLPTGGTAENRDR